MKEPVYANLGKCGFLVAGFYCILLLKSNFLSYRFCEKSYQWKVITFWRRKICYPCLEKTTSNITPIALFCLLLLRGSLSTSQRRLEARKVEIWEGENLKKVSRLQVQYQVLFSHTRDLTIQQRDGNENFALKVNLRSFVLYRLYSYSFTLSKVGEPSWSWIPRDFIHVQREKLHFVVACLRSQ